MSKPSGISLGITAGGVPTMSVTHISRAEDAIWNAVQEAVDAGMTPEQFKREVAQAWTEELRAQAKRTMKELSK